MYTVTCSGYLSHLDSALPKRKLTLNKFLTCTFAALGLATAAHAQLAFPDSLPPAQLLSDKAKNTTATAAVRYDLDKTRTLSSSQAGVGALLLDGRTGAAEAPLFAHQDLELEFDFMLTPGAEAFVGFQRSHRVSLSDGQNGRKVTPFTLGGTLSSVQYVGMPPLQNVCKSPGLWQKAYLQFKAGKGARHAQLIRAIFNGALVQTGTSFASEGNSLDQPLTFYCNKGQLALRNIRFAKTDPAAIVRWAGPVRYKAYDGVFKRITQLDSTKPAIEGTTPALEYQVAGKENEFAVRFEGQLQVPKSGTYEIGIRTGGGWRLDVNGNKVDQWNKRTVWEGPSKHKVPLNQGLNQLVLTYLKNTEGTAGLGMTVSGPGGTQTLNSQMSMFDDVPRQSFELTTARGPIVQRCFMMHEGREYPYIIAVGTPDGLHFAYDIASATLLKVWRGNFLDVTGMWYSRGADQMAWPKGAMVSVATAPAFADTLLPEGMMQKGYILEDGLPTFIYAWPGGELQDKIRPMADGSGVERTLTVTGAPPPPMQLGNGRTVNLSDYKNKGMAPFRIDYPIVEIKAGKATVPLKTGSQTVKIVF